MQSFSSAAEENRSKLEDENGRIACTPVPKQKKKKDMRALTFSVKKRRRERSLERELQMILLANCHLSGVCMYEKPDHFHSASG